MRKTFGRLYPSQGRSPGHFQLATAGHRRRRRNADEAMRSGIRGVVVVVNKSITGLIGCHQGIKTGHACSWPLKRFLRLATVQGPSNLAKPTVHRRCRPKNFFLFPFEPGRKTAPLIPSIRDAVTSIPAQNKWPVFSGSSIERPNRLFIDCVLSTALAI